MLSRIHRHKYLCYFLFFLFIIELCTWGKLYFGTPSRCGLFLPSSCSTSSVGKQSQLLLKPTEVELALQVGVEFDKKWRPDGWMRFIVTPNVPVPWSDRKLNEEAYVPPRWTYLSHFSKLTLTLQAWANQT